MDTLPRQRLREAVARYGISLGDDPHLCEAWLNDTCGEYKGEVSLLVAAAKAGVVTDLITSGSTVPRELLLRRHVKQLEKLHFTEPAARWGVESWALALGIVSDEEISPAPSLTQAPEVPAPRTEGKADRKSTPRIVHISVVLAILMLGVATTMTVLKSKADETAAAALAAQSKAEQMAREIGEAKQKAEQESRQSLNVSNKAREAAEAELSQVKQLQPRVELSSPSATVGDYGVTFYTTFRTYNLQSVQCVLKVNIYDQNGDEVATSTQRFTPSAADQSYTNFTVSVSSSYLPYEYGDYTFKVVLKKELGESKVLAETAEMPLEDEP